MPTSQASTSPFPISRATVDTREKRIATVAWRWNRQYRCDAEYKNHGFSDEEIHEGDLLGETTESEYSSNRRCYGDLAYQSCPAHATQPIKDRVLAILRRKRTATATRQTTEGA